VPALLSTTTGGRSGEQAPGVLTAVRLPHRTAVRAYSVVIALEGPIPRRVHIAVPVVVVTLKGSRPAIGPSCSVRGTHPAFRPPSHGSLSYGVSSVFQGVSCSMSGTRLLA
jgi:hypothetical protein